MVKGTPSHLSPECLEDNSDDIGFDRDLWALGVLTFYLLTGKEVFGGENVYETYRKISNINYKFPAVNISFFVYYKTSNTSSTTPSISST